MQVVKVNVDGVEETKIETSKKRNKS